MRLKSSEDCFHSYSATFFIYCANSLIFVTVLKQTEGERKGQTVFETELKKCQKDEVGV